MRRLILVIGAALGVLVLASCDDSGSNQTGEPADAQPGGGSQLD